MHTVTREPLSNIVSLWTAIFRSLNGRFFSVEFVKQDGSFRKLNGKVGSDLSVDSNGHLVVRDVQVGGFRKVNLNQITSFCSGNLNVRF